MSYFQTLCNDHNCTVELTVQGVKWFVRPDMLSNRIMVALFRRYAYFISSICRFYNITADSTRLSIVRMMAEVFGCTFCLSH